MMTSQRPQGVSILAVLYVLSGASYVFGGLLLLAMQADMQAYLSDAFSVLGFRGEFASLTALAVICLLIGAAAITVGFGLWRLREWGRMVALVLAGLGLLAAFAFIALALSADSITSAVLELIPATIYGLIVWYLLQPNVVQAFRGEAAPDWVIHEREIQVGQAATMPAPGPDDWKPASPPVRLTKPVEKPLAAAAWVVIRKGPREGQFGLSSGTNVLGRDASKCDITIEDDAMSREHAKIRFEGGRFWIYDLASRNGTFVNDRKIQRQMLMDGDQIQLGDTVFVFKETR